MKSLWFILAGCLLMTACQSEPLPYSYADLPPGDAGSGEKTFLQSINDAPSCASCHSLNDVNGIGPGLGGYGQVAATRVDGKSAEEYTFISILRPASHVVRGFSNVMYTEYEHVLEQQDIADLIAYLLSQ